MKVLPTEIDGVVLLTPKIFSDARGCFFEVFNQQKFEELTGTRFLFVQDNQSRSHRNVLRGLHYQVCKPQGKLVRVASGRIFDVVVDLREDSPSFGKHIGVYLSSRGGQMLWIPPGLAHGFLAVSKHVEVFYKTTDYYAPEYERCIIWNDPTLAIQWPIREEPILSEKDSRGKRFMELKGAE